MASFFPKNSVSRREILKQALGLSVASTTLGVFSQSNVFASNPTVLTSGYIPILDCAPLIVAYEKGFLKDNGIKAERPVLIRTWPALMEAFAAKQILLTHILLPQVMFLRYAQKLPVRSVAFNHLDTISMVRAKEIVRTIDLGGKTVACPTWWSPHNALFQELLRKEGLKPVVGKSESSLAPNEVAFKVVAPPDMIDALKTGKIAAFVVSEPFGAAAEVLAGATIMKMGGDIWCNNPCCQSVLLQETIDKDRSWSQAVINALYKAASWAHQNKQELASILGKDGGGYFPMPTKIVERALLKDDLHTYGPEGTGAIMHTDWNVHRVEFNPYPYESAFDVMLDLMKRTVVDQSAALPDQLRKLSGREIAHEIVDYDLAQAAFKNIDGIKTFGLDNKRPFIRKERYEILLKKA